MSYYQTNLTATGKKKEKKGKKKKTPPQEPHSLKEPERNGKHMFCQPQSEAQSRCFTTLILSESSSPWGIQNWWQLSPNCEITPWF